MQCPEEKCFIPPPEAPVFEPSWEEFKDPLVYIDKIRAIGERYGICKIRPPPSWEPPFAIDFDTFRFTPRIQKLNELEIVSRVKMNYLDQLSRFWSLQGLDFKIPLVEKKTLDLFRLRKIVNEEGGLEVVNSNHKWPKIVLRMGYSGAKSVGAALRSHYEKIILPYDEFRLNHSWVTDASDKLSENFCLEEAKHEVSNNEQTGSDTKTYIKVPKARRMGSEVRVKGKHMLHCYTSGTKIKITTSPMKSKDRSTSGIQKKERHDANFPSAADKYFCEVCSDGDDEEHMLLCDGCDDAYHMNCLTPPLTEVPPGDWRCPKCLVQECSKPLESYGFEQSQQEYTLETFGSMADKFKADHFSAPPQSVPYAEVEKEYWRLVSCMNKDVSVEYGADIHAGENGSGFPTEKTRDQFSGDEEYIVSGWNLNNLPVLGSSLLQFVSVDISGMKVPWCYVGMCFSSFSWHTEDHWSYSINYLHRGEAKTWYGIPGSKADLLEECMKSLAPDLFAQSPDILHQLTTIMNPNLLMAHGVPIFRTDQEAGNFIITFPRSYHAGFNQGYNFAEAVNFCPADWVPKGRGCVEHYRSLKRQCVFSHDELLCQIAENAQKVDIVLAQYVYNDLQAAIEKERTFRKQLTEQGVVTSERLMFELQGDDERQCDICNTTCFLSALKCPNRPNVVMCIDHSEVRCNCDASAHCIVYRYTLDELESLLLVLKERANQLDDWQRRAKAALEEKTEKKKDVVWLKELIVEVTSRNLPKTKDLEALKEAVSAAEVCIDISRQLLDRKIRSSNRSLSDSRNVSRVTVTELENFCQRVETLPCTFKEAVMFQDLLTSVGKFKKAAADILKSTSISSVATLEFQIDWGTRLEVDLPELTDLNEMLMIAKWLSEYEKTMTNRKSTTLLELRKLKNVGTNLQPHPSFQSSLAKVMNLLAQCENLEQRAVGCLTTGCRPSISDLESLVKESETLCVDLPHIADIRALLKMAKDWINKVEAILSDDIRFLMLDEVKSLQMQGEKIPVALELLDVLHRKLHSIDIWKDELSQVFVDKSSKEILQDLVQEIDAGGSTHNTIGAAQISGQEINGNALNNSVVERLAKLRLKKLEELRKEHSSNLIRSLEQANKYESCFNCNKDGPNHVQQCLACAAKYLDCWNKSLVLQVACEKSYVCSSCYHLKRRVAVDDVQQLVSSWRQLGFHLTEGKALEYLAAEVSRWQRMARLVLSTDEMTTALKLLGFPVTNSRIWRRESAGEKSANDAGLQSEKLSKTCGDGLRTDYSEVLPYPIDLSLSSARKEVRPKAPEDLVQKVLTDSALQQHLIMNMDLSVEAQATLSDLLLESRVLRVGTEEAQVIGFLLFAAWQRTVLVEARRKEEELRKKREEEELRRKREEELRRKREEELRRKREEEIRRRREEEELRRKREEEFRRKREEEEQRRKREEELRRMKEEEELRRKLEEEELQRKKEEEELRRREEDLRRKREEEELQRRRKEELRRRKEEEDLRRKREEEMKIREEEEKRKKKELEVNKRKEAEMRCEQLAAQMKKDALERKRFQELQRVSDEDRKRRQLDERNPEKVPKKNSNQNGQKEEKLNAGNLSKNQENKKNEENCEVQTGKNTNAKKRKAEQPLLLVEQDKKLKKDDLKVKDGQKKLKGNRNKKKKKQKSASNDDDDDDDDEEDGCIIYQEPCASKNCLNPSDPDVVEWVQCDSCDQWYHLICQGLEPKQVSGNKQYFCPSCPQPSSEVAKSEGSTSEHGLPVSSPKSKKKNASKEQNGSTPQKPQNASSNKKEEKVGIGSGPVREKSGKNIANKQVASSAAEPMFLSGALDKLARKNQSSTNVDVLKPGSEALKKKVKKTEKSFPKTASEESILKRNSVFPGWSQQLTSLAKATEVKDSRQEEGSKVTQNTYFQQYLYTPWLANKSSSVR